MTIDRQGFEYFAKGVLHYKFIKSKYRSYSFVHSLNWHLTSTEKGSLNSSKFDKFRKFKNSVGLLAPIKILLSLVSHDFNLIRKESHTLFID